MAGPLGRVVLEERSRCVRRVELDAFSPHEAYLKRTGRLPILKTLRVLLRFTSPRSPAGREAILLTRLRRDGLPAAVPLAYGETRILGIPTRSFILTHAVRGRDLHDLLVGASPTRRRDLYRLAGDLLGRLHDRGYFHIVRAKDLILTDEGDGHYPPGVLVLIDREVARPHARRFSVGRAGHGLARCAAKVLRADVPFDDSDAAAFTRAYLRASPRVRGRDRRALRRAFTRSLARIRAGHRYRAPRPDAVIAALPPAPADPCPALQPTETSPLAAPIPADAAVHPNGSRSSHAPQ